MDDFFDNDFDEPTGHNEDEEDVQDEREERERYDTDEESVLSEDDEDKSLKEEDDEDEEAQITQEEEKKEELKKKSKVVEPSKRVTNKIMTKYEYSYIVAKRAEMIEHGSPLMFPDTKFIKAIEIAMEETRFGVNPIIIRRTLPNGNIEEWKNSELLPTKNYDNDVKFV
jgi:DNA-directed RNA polymerase subunit K/omega